MKVPEYMKSQTIEYIKKHYDTLITCGLAACGPDSNAMWMASLDVHTGQPLTASQHPPQIEPRTYRAIHAPNGVNFYWDQPHLVAAHVLSEITGDARYASAADACIQAFLERSSASCGLLLWGNHYYYDATRGERLWFDQYNPPAPLGLHAITAHLHELHPIPPAWDLLWCVQPQTTRAALEAMRQHHLIDPAIGTFARHADQQPGQDDLASGGILVESMAWLYARTHERGLAELALNIARYTFMQRSPTTGLLPVASQARDWCRHTCTTEVGLWAGSLLRAAAYTGLSQFRTIARDAVMAYLNHGWDTETWRYFGRLNISDGTPQHDDTGSDQISHYQPGPYAAIWNATFPSHDYPLALAETCVSLYQQTQQPAFRRAVENWAEIIAGQTYENAPPVRYAEQFGRAIHFLLRAAQVLEENRYRVQAVELADVAIEALYAGPMFRGHSGEDRYEAVDGVGYLLLALLYLETGRQPDYRGFGF